MAFVSARIVEGGYVNHTHPDGSPKAIQIIGEITDDLWPQVWVGSLWIEGDKLASLPAADPLLDGTPADPRYRAIMGLVARFVKDKHAELTAAWLANVPKVTVRPPQEVAAMPVLTPQLLAYLAPDV